MTSQDFTKGLDFTGLTEATAAQHNQLVDQAVPTKDVVEANGVGLLLTTTDSALDTPNVPDPTASAGYNKWKRYFWNRRPFAGATVKNHTIYAWNDDAASAPTYLKWLEANSVDVAAIEAEIAAVLVIANTAQATADAAAAAAATAITVANNALNVANNAQTTANNALAIAQDPLSQIPDGSITMAKLTQVMDLTNKTVTLPAGSVTAAMLAQVLDLSTKTLTLPPGLFIAASTPVIGVPAPAVAIAPFTHNLGATPSYVQWVLQCVAAEYGYNENDEIPLEGLGSWTKNDNQAFISWKNATQLGVTRTGGSSDDYDIYIIRRDAGNVGDLGKMTVANWRLKAYYRL